MFPRRLLGPLTGVDFGTNMAVDEESQAFEQLSNLKISDGASKKENINLVSIGHVGMYNTNGVY